MKTEKTFTLSMSDVADLNNRMLGLGMPVEYDGQGYNKPDYQVGKWYSDKGIETPNHAARVLEILNHYTRTQLSSDADAIKTALDEYRTECNIIRFSGFRLEKDGVFYAALTWEYSKVWKAAVSSRRGLGGEHWVKTPSGVWEYRVSEKALPDFVKFCEQNGKITDALQGIEYPATKAAQQSDTEKPEISGLIVRVHVVESLDFPSVTQVSFEYPACSRNENQQLFETVRDMMRGVKSAYWYADTKSYHIPASLVRELVPAFAASGVSFDMAELLPVLNRYADWGKAVDSESLILPEPENFKPFPHQVEDARTMLKFRRVGNFSEMGTGKTASAIIAARNVGKTLVVCPATVVYNWQSEICQLYPDIFAQVLETGKTQLDAKAVFVIASYETASKRYSDLLKAGFRAIVLDEAHYVKAISAVGLPTAQRGKALLYLASRIEYAFPMTGTPVVNNNGDLFNLLTILGHSSTIGGFAFKNYMEQYNDVETRRGHTVYVGAKNSDLLYRNIRNYFVRHLRKEVLPDLVKVRTPIYSRVDLSEYDRYVAEFLRKRQTDGAEALVALGKARESIAILKAYQSAKFALDLVESGEKVVIFVSFEKESDIFENAFQKSGVDYVVINGKVSKKARNERKNRFQNDAACKIAIVSFGAGAEGQTLTAACNLIVNSYPWTVAKLTQGEDRICRAGQTRACTIHLVTAIGADVDVKMTMTLTAKGALASDVIDNGGGDRCNLIQLLTEGKDSGEDCAMLDDLPENF